MVRADGHVTGDPTGTSGDGDETSAADDVDTSGPSSVPIPLLVLGGLALLLLAAGGAGYLSRRAQARREGGPPARLEPYRRLDRAVRRPRTARITG